MDALLIVPEVAEILRVRPTTVYSLVARDILPHVRIAQGKRRALIRFRRADVETFLEQRSAGITRPDEHRQLTVGDDNARAV